MDGANTGALSFPYCTCTRYELKRNKYGTVTFSTDLLYFRK